MAQSMRSVDWLEYAVLTVYCVWVWLFYAFIGLKSKRIFDTATREDKEELRQARDRFWNLSKEWEGFSHKFLDLKNGFRMHYVSNASAELIASDKPIVIFLHGFPDSWAVWRHIITAPSVRDGCIVVAVDMPGYGGTESLPDYGPNKLLTAVAGFIAGVRNRYERPEGGGKRRAIIAAHDWGCAIAFRLAAEAPQLADRFILTNGPMNFNSLDNFNDCRNTAVACLKQGRFREAREAFKPALQQLLMSHYIVLFQSPITLLRIFATVGDYAWIRACHEYVSGQGKPIPASELLEFLASTLGPDVQDREVAASAPKSGRYPASVVQRGADFALLHPMRYYREGAFTQTWKKQQDLKESLEELGPCEIDSKKLIRAKTTVIWGMNDKCLSVDICLRNMNKYLLPGSQIVELPRSGHGTPVEPESRAAFTKVLEWAISGQDKDGDVGRAIADVYPDARVTVRG